MARPKKKILKHPLLVGGLIGIGAYYLLLAKKSSPATSGIVGMGRINTRLITGIAFEEIVGSIRRVAKDLGGFINKASMLTGVPAWLINVISAHEIRFKPYKTINPAVKATGPMQITPPTLFDMYYVATQWGLVTPQLVQFLGAKMGKDFARFVALASRRASDGALATTYLLDPEVNMVMGGLLLSCLSRLFNDGQKVNDARLVLGYNRGIGWSLVQTSKALGISQTKLIQAVAQPGWRLPASLASATPDSLLASAPDNEAKNYLKDVLGTGGYFDQARSGGL